MHLKMIQNNYIILDVIKVDQLQSGIVFTGKITFKELSKIYKLTERQEKKIDPFSENNDNTLEESNIQFQRQLSDKKLNEIKNFLLEELSNVENDKSLGLFPSSLILYNRLYEDDDLFNEDDNKKEELSEKIIFDNYKEDLDCCFFLQQKDHFYKIYIPQNKNITLIVDGQHRFSGTQLLYNTTKDQSIKERLENFEFIITYLAGFDIYEVGQIFATVNFNQKPVNRSLYYDIFGSAPQTDRNGNLQNDIRLAHDLAVHLNNSKISPINGMIKLLGRGYGLFSQAFFVLNTLRVFKSGIWNELIIDYLNDGKDYLKISKFIRAMFDALKESYPSAWPNKSKKFIKKINEEQEVYSSYDYKYILCKTTGLGAYFRLIKDIYPLISHDEKNFEKNLKEYFSKISNEEAEKLFSKNGEYGGAGSEGLQDKLYKVLKSKYGLI